MKSLVVCMPLVILCIGCVQDSKRLEQAYSGRLKPVTIALEPAGAIDDTLNISVSATTNIPRDFTEAAFEAIPGKDIVYLTIQIDRPHVVDLFISNKNYKVLAMFGDTVRVKLFFNEGQAIVQFSGMVAEVSNYYLKKTQFLGYSDIRVPLNQNFNINSSYRELLWKTDSIVKVEKQFLVKEGDALPQWLFEYELAEIEFAGAGFKTQIPTYNKTFEVFRDSLPVDYYQYLENVAIDNPNGLLSSQYLWFLDEYFLVNSESKAFTNLQGQARLSAIHALILPQSFKVLSGEVKDIYHKYMLAAAAQFARDTTELDSIAKLYEVEDYSDLVGLMNRRSSVINGRSIAVNEKTLDFYLIDETDSAHSIREFADQVVFVNFWATWCGPCLKGMPMWNELVADYEDRTDIVFLSICIDSEKEAWKRVSQKHRLAGENRYAEGRWSELLRSAFDIYSIPRYVLLDVGNLVVANPAGSASTVRPDIEKLLQK